METKALLSVVEAAAQNGVDWVQVRDHSATSRDLYDLARSVLAICKPLGVRVAVNDRIDIALAVAADAVQLGSRSLPIVAAKGFAGGMLIGASVHTVPEGMEAADVGASWITFGHFFPTSSHGSQHHRDIGQLVEMVRKVHIPVIAIGGIGVHQVAQVMECGATGVAVISSILDAPDPGGAAADLRTRLDRILGHTGEIRR